MVKKHCSRAKEREPEVYFRANIVDYNLPPLKLYNFKGVKKIYATMLASLASKTELSNF